MLPFSLLLKEVKYLKIGKAKTCRVLKLKACQCLPSLCFCFSPSFSQLQLNKNRSTNISIGSSLTPTTNSSWLSPSGLYAFGFYPQGNGFGIGIFLAGIPQRTVVWTANRDDPLVSNNATLLLTNDSGLVLQEQGQTKTIISYPQPPSSASLFDSGNFVLYTSELDKIWQSFEHPTDTLLPSQRLGAGSELVSAASRNDHSSGIFRLSMQEDGNLVQYPVATPQTAVHSYWSSGTFGQGDNVSLNFADDGHLYLLNSTGFNIKDLTGGGYPTNDTIYIMRIDFDGIFRLYSHNLKQDGNWSALWRSSNNKCDPKGLCGLNSYCVLNDQEPDCICIPGFVPGMQNNWTAGCERSFIPGNCKDKNGDIRIQEITNSGWEDDSYSVLTVFTKEDCERACLEDCNCDAAFFNNMQCRKQRLPLRYGKRNLGDSNIALIKVGKSISTTDRIEPGKTKSDDKLDNAMLILSCSIVAVGFFMLAISGIVFYRSRVQAYKRLSATEHVGLSEEVSPRSYTFTELEKITDGFKEEIGRGSFGAVYKGLLLSTQKGAAVKRLEGVASQGEREFQTEVKVIGKTHHKNLVRLLGYCNEGPHRLLVYEYMSNGSLADVLFCHEKRPCFAERVEIARNIAKGILYLHEECETQIIHCDIKPENILLDEYGCPKISDFGLAKLLKPEQTKTFTGIRGTIGYVAPEWHRKLPVTVKADVYSFGIVLLEIACCRRNVDHALQEIESILVDWVYHCFEGGEIDKLAGDEEVDKKQMDRMIKVGLWCTLDEPSIRPSMKKVLLMLEGTIDIPIPPSPTSFLSSI